MIDVVFYEVLLEWCDEWVGIIYFGGCDVLLNSYVVGFVELYLYCWSGSYLNFYWWCWCENVRFWFGNIWFRFVNLLSWW